MSKILILTGGTGGHVFPALNLSKFLRSKGFEICWSGNAAALEERIATSNHFKFCPIAMHGLRKTSFWSKLALPFIFLKACFATFKILKAQKPDLVIGFGNYISTPGYLMAFMLGIPYCIQEQNQIMGLANKLGSFGATKVFLPSDPDTFPKNLMVDDVDTAVLDSINDSKYIKSGNPIHEELFKIAHKKNDFAMLNLLVLGGSLGAKFINELVPALLLKLQQFSTRIHVIHQTGSKNFEETMKIYQNLGLDMTHIELVPFIDNMPKAYDWANFLLARSGAMTISEVSAIGIPAIFIPYPYAVDNHQYFNALPLVESKRALVFQENECKLDNLVAIFFKILETERVDLRIFGTTNTANEVIYEEIVGLL